MSKLFSSKERARVPFPPSASTMSFTRHELRELLRLFAVVVANVMAEMLQQRRRTVPPRRGTEALGSPGGMDT